jgi:menaquinol-cytochrome c reductase cytochrome b/c subunit
MAVVDEKRAQFTRYKEDVQSRGKAFYPFAMFHDTVMSVVVVSVIIGLACVWYFTSDEQPGDEGSGWLGPRYAEKADPGTTSFIPRPDWYFYFLFYLLRIFKWPESVILATVGIPTIALVLLLAVPFIDLRRERRPLRRPVAIVAGVLVILSMGVLTYKGATVKESLGGGLTDGWVARNNLPEAARPGADLFQEAGCMGCHSYLGAGAGGPGPELTSVGAASGKNEDYFFRYVSNPRAFGNNVMPVYGGPNGLGDKNLRNLAIFLAASKGGG